MSSLIVNTIALPNVICKNLQIVRFCQIKYCRLYYWLVKMSVPEAQAHILAHRYSVSLENIGIRA